jgi:hypothetical protein
LWYVAAQVFAMTVANGIAFAQSGVDPKSIEFIPSDSEQAKAADGTSVVSGYEIEIAVAGSTQVLQRTSVGKPAHDADGMIRVGLAQVLTKTPAAGTSYTARVITVGPQGSTASTPSNTFTFSACQYSLSATSASYPAAGGSGSVTVSTSASWCAWNATSTASWLQASGSGTGNGAANITAAANTTGSSRTASISFGGATLTVTQAAGGTQTRDIATEADLQAALKSLTSDTVLRLAPGIYRLSSGLQIAGPLANVVLKGSTGRPNDVVLEGQGMTTNGTAAVGVTVTGAVQKLQISDLTIQNVYRNAVSFDSGVQAPRLSNVRLINCGDVCLTVANSSGTSVDDGVVEGSWIGYTTTGAATTAGGIDLRGAHRWKIVANAFQNIVGPNGQTARPAVVAANGAADTSVERNAFSNVKTAVAFGLVDLAGGYDHQGGRIANNFVYRASTVPGGAAVSIVDSPSTIVAHNTILLSKTYESPIEYRYPDTTDVRIVNNLLDGSITALNGAAAVLAGNVTTATPAMFVNAAAGDLHLQPTATAAIDMGDLSAQETTDIDADSRPLGLGPDVGADEVSAVNAPPVVQLASPVNGTIYRTGASLSIQAQAQDPDGSVASVEFYVNSTLISRATKAPFTASWSPKNNGTYSIMAVAVDNAGARASSQTVTVTANKKGR